LPFALDGGDSSDGPKDEINIYVAGIDRNASFQLRLDMRLDTIVVRWGAQKAFIADTKIIEQAAPSNR
jgi:hypothetical protein